MRTNKSRFIVILIMLSMVAVACGGDTAEDVAETPEVTEAPQETLAAPATTVKYLQIFQKSIEHLF